MNQLNQFVYHRLPVNMKGKVLCPLNSMRESEPEIFNAAAEKYAWRSYLMNQWVEPLACLWNDVIHLTPLNPAITLRELSLISPLKSPRQIKFVKIPFENLQREKACWFHPALNIEGSATGVDSSAFSPIVEYAELQELPVAQVARWKADVDNGRPLLLWSQTTHVLYAGEISICGMEILEVNIGSN